MRPRIIREFNPDKAIKVIAKLHEVDYKTAKSIYYKADKSPVSVVNDIAHIHTMYQQFKLERNG
jgi:hypothetical protein